MICLSYTQLVLLSRFQDQLEFIVNKILGSDSILFLTDKKHEFFVLSSLHLYIYVVYQVKEESKMTHMNEIMTLNCLININLKTLLINLKK